MSCDVIVCNSQAYLRSRPKECQQHRPHTAMLTPCLGGCCNALTCSTWEGRLKKLWHFWCIAQPLTSTSTFCKDPSVTFHSMSICNWCFIQPLWSELTTSLPGKAVRPTSKEHLKQWVSECCVRESESKSESVSVWEWVSGSERVSVSEWVGDRERERARESVSKWASEQVSEKESH